ncbi:uncharacterized protein PgNI_03579 [Pyricularia grisea]|uniref:Uncharacterized protein n=1 Tax=Pyricularia grisea TaxID=148305 RepID=A0A6P8BB52_PYRGI|nr:uncharacterized protein PgNI_03579 [Pyricularia grisea]TLD13066.1 hypothetical protein PgNI_03579 [Pyricularia grisea]
MEEANKVLILLHSDEESTAQELIQICEQLILENEHSQQDKLGLGHGPAVLTALHPPDRHGRFYRVHEPAQRCQRDTKNFQSSLHEALDLTGKQALLISGYYGMMGRRRPGYLPVVRCGQVAASPLPLDRPGAAQLHDRRVDGPERCLRHVGRQSRWCAGSPSP